MFSGDDHCASSDPLWSDLGLSFQKSLQLGVFVRLYFKEFYPESMLQDPLDFGG
jgi:hypothetical protein